MYYAISTIKSPLAVKVAYANIHYIVCRYITYQVPCY